MMAASPEARDERAMPVVLRISIGHYFCFVIVTVMRLITVPLISFIVNWTASSFIDSPLSGILPNRSNTYPPMVSKPSCDRSRRSEEHTSELQSRLHLV